MTKLEKGNIAFISIVVLVLWVLSCNLYYNLGKHTADRWWQAQQKEYGIVPKIEFVPNPHLSSVCQVEWQSKVTGKKSLTKWMPCSETSAWLRDHDASSKMTVIEKPLWVTGEPKDAK